MNLPRIPMSIGIKIFCVSIISLLIVITMDPLHGTFKSQRFFVMSLSWIVDRNCWPHKDHVFVVYDQTNGELAYKLIYGLRKFTYEQQIKDKLKFAPLFTANLLFTTYMKTYFLLVGCTPMNDTLTGHMFFCFWCFAQNDDNLPIGGWAWNMPLNVVSKK